jgi:hypothetical protein
MAWAEKVREEKAVHIGDHWENGTTWDRCVRLLLEGGSVLPDMPRLGPWEWGRSHPLYMMMADRLGKSVSALFLLRALTAIFVAGRDGHSLI